jgi:hypothetical protein
LPLSSLQSLSLHKEQNKTTETMAETPSWLSNDQPAVATTPAPVPGGSALEADNAARGGATSESNFGVSESDDKDLPGVILTMRLANMGVSAYLITVSVRLPVWL